MKCIARAQSNDLDRRRFISTAAMFAAAAELGIPTTAAAQPASPRTDTSFRQLKQIDAGPLNIGYVEAGPAGGIPVVLLHGWPYDIHSYAEVVPLLEAQGFRVIVPYLRGYGSTRFRASHGSVQARSREMANRLLWPVMSSR
jgi:alpha-beta hydrolase superfamily lysophospholipase